MMVQLVMWTTTMMMAILATVFKIEMTSRIRKH